MKDLKDIELIRKAEWAERMAAEHSDPYFKLGWLDIAASYRRLLARPPQSLHGSESDRQSSADKD